MSGRQVYISEKQHKKLKVASMRSEKDMGEIVGEFIEDMDVPGWKQAIDYQGQQKAD